MNKFRKAMSVGMSAALLASLFTVIAASSVSAGTTVTSVGTVPRGGTSTTAATFNFTEKSAAALTGACAFTVTITDSASGATVHFVGAGTQSGPGSLGLDPLTVGDNFFTVSITDQDPLNVENVLVGGLQISADTTAATGAIKANVTSQVPGGCFAAAFIGGTVTASGHLAQAYGIGTTSFAVALDLGSCPFDLAGNVTVGSETVTPDGAPAADTPVVGQYTFANTGDPFTINHLANEVVTQTATNCATTVLGSPGSVADSAKYNPATTIDNVFPGEANQDAGNLSITERTAGFLAEGSTVTFTIATAGVTFSNAPLFCTTGDVVTPINCGTGTTFVVTGGALSVDGKSVSYTVDTASAAPASLLVFNINYDVAASVPQGTQISVTAALSAGAVVPTSRVNAVVGRIINASASPVPTVFIGQNAQKTGLITMTEVAAGSFTDGTGSFNTFVVCVDENGDDTFTSPGPWAKVTAGDLRLREGAGSSPDNIVQGTPLTVEGNPCYYWTVWTASTTASTIQIGTSDFASGALINVAADDTPGPVLAGLYVGSVSAGITSADLQVRVQIATQVFQNSVVVTALSQPTIAKGSTDARPGDIQIAETANGQLKNNEDICVEVLPRTSNEAIQDTFLRNLNTSDTPVVTTSGGLLVGSVSLSNRGCEENFGLLPLTPSGTHTISFSFEVLQQSTAGNGKLVISNMHFITTADAPTGPVLVNVFGFGGSPTFVEFQSTVSNARIGSAQVDAWIAAGNNVRTASAFGLNTVIVKQGARVTLRFKGADATAGDLVQIWVKTKTTAWKLETNRRITSDGYAYYSPRVLNHGYRYYRVLLNGNISNTVRAFGK